MRKYEGSYTIPVVLVGRERTRSTPPGANGLPTTTTVTVRATITKGLGLYRRAPAGRGSKIFLSRMARLRPEQTGLLPRAHTQPTRALSVSVSSQVFVLEEPRCSRPGESETSRRGGVVPVTATAETWFQATGSSSRTGSGCPSYRPRSSSNGTASWRAKIRPPAGCTPPCPTSGRFRSRKRGSTADMASLSASHRCWHDEVSEHRPSRLDARTVCLPEGPGVNDFLSIFVP